jgi:SAM-dependent methyltransferase
MVGIELSDTGVEIARKKVPEAKFIQADLFQPPEELKKYIKYFNVAICSDVIEHVDDPVEFCKNLKGYIKSGGYLFLTVPGGPMSAFDKHIGHRKHYNKEDISKLLVSAGFRVINIKMAGFPFFNLYRLIVIMRGKRLISDVSKNATRSFSMGAAKLMMNIFNILFNFNTNHSKYGWQVFAIAKVEGSE